MSPESKLFSPGAEGIEDFARREEISHRAPLYDLLNRSEPTRRFTEAKLISIEKDLRQNGHRSLSVSDILPGSDSYPPPLVRAAENPDPEVLRALLEVNHPQWDLSEWFDGWDEGTSPLRTAIKAGLIANVRLLLDHGADPQWLPDESFIQLGHTISTL